MHHACRPNRLRGAFTLVELLVVVAIIALLLAILLPSLNKAREQAVSLACLAHVRQVSTFLHLYASEYDGVAPANSSGKTSADGTLQTHNWPHFLGEAGYEQIAYAESPASNFKKALRCPKLAQRVYAVYVDNGGNLLPGEFATQPYLAAGGNYTFSGLRISQVRDAANYAHVACAVRNDGTGNTLSRPITKAGFGFQTHKRFNASGAVDDIWLGHLARSNMAFADGHGETVDPARMMQVNNYSPNVPMDNHGIDSWWDENGDYINIYPP